MENDFINSSADCIYECYENKVKLWTSQNPKKLALFKGIKSLPE